jgi:parallel beta-helix repeat protein
MIEEYTSVSQKKNRYQNYSPHSPILITSNNHFVLEGFNGAGTYDDPYMIENFNITESSSDLINISNTTVYFQINNVYLNGLLTTTSGISLSNVQNAIIENNFIHSNSAGIKVTNSSDLIFHNNSIFSNLGIGIMLDNITNCSLISNFIHDNLVTGLYLKNSCNTTISYNHISNHHYGEFFRSGILLTNSINTLINNNSLFNNHYGINLLNSANNNLIINNTIYENLRYGLRLEYASNNVIEYNTISKNQFYGMQIKIGCNNNTINYNTYTDNNEGKAQAADDGVSNAFTGNYWNDWPIQDVNEDLINDNPYPIDGNANNTDLYPLIVFSNEAINNLKESTNNSDFLMIILFGVVVVGGSTGVGYYKYKNRLGQQDIEDEFESMEFFTDLKLSEQIERVKPLYHKLVVGIENLKPSKLTRSADVPLLEPVEPTSIVEYFPSNIKHDLQSGMKWRTISTLIEIAYQDPSVTNPTSLAQSLNISASTLSKEIKNLKELQYIESYVSPNVLRDGRYRSYTITQKGFYTLYTLKEVLKITINRLKEQRGAY